MIYLCKNLKKVIKEMIRMGEEFIEHGIKCSIKEIIRANKVKI